jgi:hypothetical protein
MKIYMSESSKSEIVCALLRHAQTISESKNFENHRFSKFLVGSK